jgi:hypothetical protein
MLQLDIKGFLGSEDSFRYRSLDLYLIKCGKRLCRYAYMFLIYTGELNPK